jgi:hypothetical protein
MGSNTINNIDNSDDAAEFKFFGQANAIFLLEFRQIVGRAQTFVTARMNQQRPAMLRTPGSILDVFASVDDQPRPWLPER